MNTLSESPTTYLVVAGLIVWLVPVLALLIGSLLTAPPEERLTTPRGVLMVLCWPVLAILFIVRPNGRN